MKYIIINIILLIIISIIIFIKKDDKKEKIKVIEKHYNKIAFLLLFLVIITTIYKLGKVPSGIHVDEAGMFYDAKLLAKYGYDRYLNKLPIYLINYGDGQSAMYAYITALLIKLFGNRLILMRIPAVIFRIISFISAYFLIKNEEDKLKRILFLFLLTITPYFIMQSRLGIDCNLLVSFMTISISLFINSVNKKNNILLFISGILFGLSLYTYALSYIIIPLFLMLILTYLLYIKKINYKQIIILFIPLILLAIPLILMILVNQGIIKEIHSIITIPKLKIYRSKEISLTNIFLNFRILFVILTYDEAFFGQDLSYNAAPYFGTIYYISIPFVIIGLQKICFDIKNDIKNKKSSINIVMTIWLISVIVCMLLIKWPNINKSNAVFIPLIYLIAMGILSTIKNNKKYLKYILIIYSINYIIFLQYYYFEYNKKQGPEHCMVTYYLSALDYAKQSDKEIVYIDPRITNEPYIYIYMNSDIDAKEFNKDIIQYDNKKYIIGIPYIIEGNALYITKYPNKNSNYKEIGNVYIISNN